MNKKGATTGVAIAIAIAIGFSASTGHAVAQERWKIMDPIGDYQIAVVHEDHWLDREIYREIISTVCERQSNHCKVLYWKDESLVPTRFPMRHENSSGIVAYDVFDARDMDYPNGHGWSCEIVNDPEICFDLY